MQHTPLGLVLFALTCAAGAQRTTALHFRALPDFDVLLPQETWRRGNDGVAIPHAGGAQFAAAVDGLTLHVDTNGDGRLDEVFKGTTHEVTLRGRRTDGTPFPYVLRARTTGLSDTFSYTTGCAMTGVVEGVPLALFDQDVDGDFDEVGVDAVVVGHGPAASFLSRVVNLGGRLFWLEVDPTGRSVTTKPYEGPAGVLDLRSGLKVEGRLASAVVSDLAGKWSFEVGTSVRGTRVPAGVYVFSGGLAVKGAEKGKLGAGRMRPLVVEEGATVTLRWGAPLQAEFSATRTGDRVTIGQTVRYFGRGGEEWIPPRSFDRVPRIETFDAGKRTESQPLETC
jgi:hypothetical protein